MHSISVHHITHKSRPAAFDIEKLKTLFSEQLRSYTNEL